MLTETKPDTSPTKWTIGDSRVCLHGVGTDVGRKLISLEHKAHFERTEADYREVLSALIDLIHQTAHAYDVVARQHEKEREN